MNDTTMKQLVAQAKKYARIDYTDDDDLVEIMVDAVLEGMGEVIPRFNPENLTGRQRVILCKSVKSLYDDRDSIGSEKQEMKLAAASMLMSEIYEAKAVQLHE